MDHSPNIDLETTPPETGIEFNSENEYLTSDLISQIVGPGLSILIIFRAFGPGSLIREIGPQIDYPLIEITKNAFVVVNLDGLAPLERGGLNWDTWNRVELKYCPRKMILSASFNFTPFTTVSKSARRNFPPTEYMYYSLGRNFTGRIAYVKVETEGWSNLNTPSTILFEQEFQSDINYFEPKPVTSSTKKESEKNLKDYLSSLVNNTTLSDVTFVVDGQKIYGHKIILSRIKYFNILLNGKFQTGDSVTIHDIDSKSFLDILKSIYTEEAPVFSSDEEVVCMCLYADRFGLENLTIYCASEFRKRITISNITDLLQVAIDFPTPLLKDQCLDFISLHYRSVIHKTEGFKQIKDVELLREILTKCTV